MHLLKQYHGNFQNHRVKYILKGRLAAFEITCKSFVRKMCLLLSEQQWAIHPFLAEDHGLRFREADLSQRRLEISD